MSSFYNMLNQFVNNVNLETLKQIGGAMYFFAGAIVYCFLIMDCFVSWDGQNEVSSVRFHRHIAFYVLCFYAVGALCSSIIPSYVAKCRTMPGYKEPAEDIAWVDNNGIFGTGYGGIGEAAEVQPPVVVIGEDGAMIARNDNLGPGPREMASLPNHLER